MPARVRPCFICGARRECRHRERDRYGYIEPTLQAAADQRAAYVALRRAEYLLGCSRFDQLRHEFLTCPRFREAIAPQLPMLEPTAADLYADVLQEIAETPAAPAGPPLPLSHAVLVALLEGPGAAYEIALDLGAPTNLVAAHMTNMRRRRLIKPIGRLAAEDSTTGAACGIYALTGFGHRTAAKYQSDKPEKQRVRSFLRPRYHGQKQARAAQFS